MAPDKIKRRGEADVGNIYIIYMLQYSKVGAISYRGGGGSSAPRGITCKRAPTGMDARGGGVLGILFVVCGEEDKGIEFHYNITNSPPYV